MPQTRIVLMSASPTFSVVIPLYNKGRFVAEAVRSALDQGAAVTEVIVVDDGSVDDGAAAVEAIADPRVILVRQPNGGVSSARNRGIERAGADYVAFLDADDFWLPGFVDAIRTMIAAFPQCRLFATRFLDFDETGRRTVAPDIWGFDDRPRVVEDFYALWARGSFFCMNSIVVERALFAQTGIRFATGESWGEDQDVYFQLAERAPMAHDPRPLVAYRSSTQVSQLSRQTPQATQFRGGLLPYMVRAQRRFESGAVPPRLRPGLLRLLVERHQLAAIEAIESGQRVEALRRLFDGYSVRKFPKWLILLAIALVPGSYLGRRLHRIRARRARGPASESVGVH
jgi:glycosyltransferase involved in cell wall biosynthesis